MSVPYTTVHVVPIENYKNAYDSSGKEIISYTHPIQKICSKNDSLNPNVWTYFNEIIDWDPRSSSSAGIDSDNYDAVSWDSRPVDLLHDSSGYDPVLTDQRLAAQRWYHQQSSSFSATQALDARRRARAPAVRHTTNSYPQPQLYNAPVSRPSLIERLENPIPGMSGLNLDNNRFWHGRQTS